MKKIYFLGSLAFMALFASCDKDGTNETTRLIPSPALSIITNLNDESVNVSDGVYMFDLNISYEAMKGTVASPELISNNQNLAFTTLEQPYKSTNYDAFFTNAKGTVGNTGMELYDATFHLVYLYDETLNPYGYYFTEDEAGEYTFLLKNQPYLYKTIAKYDIGSSYKVNTFPKDVFFKGTTTTTYPQSPDPYTNENIIYRFIINKEKEATNYTATFVIYNSKFSAIPQEPVHKCIVVKGLDVDFTPEGVVITGNEIVPDMLEAGQLTPIETYTFNEVSFETTNDLYTQGKIYFKVAGMYEGNFTGSYISAFPDGY